MTPAQLSEHLNGRIESVCRHLLPDGKRIGHEWVVGNVEGAAGDSLKICLTGMKVGVGADFATGQTFGDMLDVWQSIKGIGLPQAMAEANAWLGLAPDARESRPKRAYRRPDRPKEVHRLNPQGAVMAYLKSRGITEVTLTAYRIAEQPGHLRFPRLTNNPGTIIFPYFRNGELINCKYLAIARPDGKKQTMQEGGAEPCLFGWQAIPDRCRNVVITEGEIDAMTLYQFGIPALSVPMGGGGGAKQDWIEADYDELQRFDVLFLWLDNDAAGKAATTEIVRRLGAERCRIVECPNPYKDANECLLNGKFTQVDFARCITSARTLDPDELKPVTAYLDAVLHEFYPAPGTPTGLATPWPKVGEHLRFRPGETTVWTGFNGHGKSLVLNHIAACGLMREERFCIASMEMQPAKTLKRMVRQLTGMKEPNAGYIRHCIKQLSDKLWLFDLVGTAKSERMLEVFSYAARRYQINNFIVDSLAKCGLGEDDYNGQKALVERLVDFAHKHNAHVHLVSHSRKSSDENSPPGKMDVKGTGAITDLVDNVLTIWRNKPKEARAAQAEADNRELDLEQQDKPDAALIVSKQRHGESWEGEIWLWYHADSMQYLERSKQRPAIYVDYMGVKNERTD